jgi:acetyltransferase-like isoleucine patch superfamily enzyme
MHKLSDNYSIMRKTSRFLYLISEVVLFTFKFFEGLVQLNSSRLAVVLRSKLYKTDCFIDTGVFIVNPYNFIALKDTALYHGCYILNAHGQFFMGTRSHLGAYCYVNVLQGKIRIGNDVAIGPGTKLFAYSNHFEKGSKVTDTHITNNINIGNNVFIGANCSILPGAIIHDNVIVGAGSVVIGELESNNIYAGAPCKLLRTGWYV